MYFGVCMSCQFCKHLYFKTILTLSVMFPYCWYQEDFIFYETFRNCKTFKSWFLGYCILYTFYNTNLCAGPIKMNGVCHLCSISAQRLTT